LKIRIYRASNSVQNFYEGNIEFPSKIFLAH